MRVLCIIFGGIILLFSIPAFLDPKIYWEWHKLNLWLTGIKGSKPTKFYLLMVRIGALLVAILGTVAIVVGVFGDVE